MDESGHDHRVAPWEVRGGVCLHASKLWAFIGKVRGLEYHCFGTHLADHRTELKGEKLLKSKRFTLAHQQPHPFLDQERQELCRRLLSKGARSEQPTRNELSAYGQACLLFGRRVYEVLENHDAKIFAARIPRGTGKLTAENQDRVRKDHFFLLQRFERFVKANNETGLLVMDESDKTEDRRYRNRLERFMVRHEEGRKIAECIVPTPFFVDSGLSYPVQVADIAIYCVNWGFRVGKNAPAPPRPEIEAMVGESIYRLMDRRKILVEGKRRVTSSIFDVNDPWEYRSAPDQDKEKEGNAVGVVFRAPLSRASNNNNTPKNFQE